MGSSRSNAWGTALVVMAMGASAGCSGGNLASEIAKPPENPHHEPKCGTSTIQPRPLIVEWPSSDRAALEGRIKQGLVPVRYVGCDMEVLTTCKLPATYVYSGITPKNDKVVIHNNDELYANIPVYAAKFEAKLQKAGSLEIAMTIIGRYESNRPTVHADELQGECTAATHVISALTVGAFMFSAGGSAEIGASAGVQNVGAGARSSASNETLNTDGDSKQCEKATYDDKAPPFGCGALLRVELLPVAEARKEAQACTGGSTWDGKQCVAPAGKACAEGTHDEPGKGCVANAAASATTAGSAGSTADTYQKSCDGGDSRACVTLGEMFYNARGVAKDAPRGVGLFKKACDKNEPTGCVDLGWAYSTGTGVEKNATVAADYFGKACTGSVTVGCLGLGGLYKDGNGVPKDPKRAAALMKQACDGGIDAGCKLLKGLLP
jgi:hypothetical protein